MLILMVQGCLKSPRCLLHDVCSAGHRFRGAPLLASRHGDLSPGEPAVNLLKQHPPCRGMEKSLAGKGERCPARRSRAGGMGRHGPAQHLSFCTWPLLAPPVPLPRAGICPGTSRPCPGPTGRSWAGIWGVSAQILHISPWSHRAPSPANAPGAPLLRAPSSPRSPVQEDWQ